MTTLEDERSLPLPLATAGIGLLITFALPGGLSGGVGFLIGLVVGFLPGLMSTRFLAPFSVAAELQASPNVFFSGFLRSGFLRRRQMRFYMHRMASSAFTNKAEDERERLRILLQLSAPTDKADAEMEHELNVNFDKYLELFREISGKESQLEHREIDSKTEKDS